MPSMSWVSSSISAAPLPGTHAPPQNDATTPPANQPATQPSSSGQKITATPVSYPEIKGAYNRPIGYVNAQGQNVYFPNGQIPSNFVARPEQYGPDLHYDRQQREFAEPSSPDSRHQLRRLSRRLRANRRPIPSTRRPTVLVSYPEIKDGYGRAMGYINAQGQAVYFPNGQMPAGFSVGPNNTIQTYIKSTT